MTSKSLYDPSQSIANFLKNHVTSFIVRTIHDTMNNYIIPQSLGVNITKNHLKNKE